MRVTGLIPGPTLMVGVEEGREFLFSPTSLPSGAGDTSTPTEEARWRDGRRVPEGVRMYGKWFDSAYTGSMVGAGADVYAVMGYAVAHAKNSSVELNPKLIAAQIGMPVENVDRAIQFLCQPDPNSRNPAQDGSRLVREGQFQYHVVSHELYRKIRDDEMRRNQNRQSQRRHRGQPLSADVSHGQPPSAAVSHGQPRQPMSAQSEAEAEADISEATLPHPAEGGEDGKKKSPDDEKKETPEEGKKKTPEELIYEQYPRRESKATAVAAIAKALKRIQKGELGHPPMPKLDDARRYLYRRVVAFARSPAGTRDDREHIPHPATWMNGARYLDEEENWQAVGNGNQPSKPKLNLNPGTGPRDLADRL